jgi:hypothetical protein
VERKLPWCASWAGAAGSWRTVEGVLAMLMGILLGKIGDGSDFLAALGVMTEG